MRKLFLSLFVLVPFVASAQNTKPFKVNVAAGYAATADYSNSDAPTKGGFVYSVEPQYRIVKNLDLGLRFEHSFVQRPEYIDKVIVFQTNAKYILSGLLTATYSLPLKGKFIPYVGVGGGLYHTAPSTQSYRPFNITVTYPLPATNVLGGLARVGVKWGRINLDGAYNMVSTSSVKTSSTGLSLEGRNSYYSVKVGFTIGGGDAE
ncbi:hypothetical protein [Spirosoma sp.]|uniref:hypothetical protein n=1 Tax=Spirosoma sp. TaxID=1899569 RepID=UPI003B3B170D